MVQSSVSHRRKTSGLTITMRHYELLREYSRDKTVENWGKKIAARVEQDRTLKSNFKDVTEPEQITKFVADFVIEPLERADPTKNNQYVQNLIKFYIAGEQLEDLKSTAVDYLKKFHKLKAKKQIPSPRNDINRYANFGDFASVIDEYPDPEKAEKSKGDAQEVYKDANVRIITPKNTEAACYYGQGTRWCTAADNNNLFDVYNLQGPMYILLPTKQKYNGEKYQIHPESQQYMDETDKAVSAQDLMDRFGPDFQSWLFKVDPSLKLQVQFYSDDAKLESAWGEIAEIVEDWLQDDGYVDDDGNIKNILEIGQMPAYEIKELASNSLEDMGYETPRQITDLADVYDYAIKLAAGSESTEAIESGSELEPHEKAIYQILKYLRTVRVELEAGEIIVYDGGF